MQPGPSRTQQSPNIVQQREVAGEDHHGPGHRRSQAEPGRRNAIDPRRASVPDKCRHRGVAHKRVEISHRHGVGTHHNGVGGQGLCQRSHHGCAGEAIGLDDRFDGIEGRGVEPLPLVQPRRLGIRAGLSLAGAKHRQRVDTVMFGGGERCVGPPIVGVDQHNMLGTNALEPQPNRLGRRAGPNPHDNVWYQLVDHCRMFEQVIGGIEDDAGRTIGGPHLRERFGYYRPANAASEVDDAICKLLLAGEPRRGIGANNDHPSLIIDQSVENRQRIRTSHDIGDRAPSWPWRHWNRAHRFQWFAQRPVAVDRAGAIAGRGLKRSHRRHRGCVGRPVARDRQIAEPAHVRAVDANLIDGLARPPTSQLGRSVGGADDHRHSGVVGLDHRW